MRKLINIETGENEGSRSRCGIVSKIQVFLCGLSDVLIVTNAIKFRYEYVIKRMELHFKD